MEKGDIIRVSIVRRADMGPEHFGVFDGDRGVYHFQGSSSDNAIVKWSTLRAFENGGHARVYSYYDKAFIDNEIMHRAQSKITSKFAGYNIATNNCEHFATWCVTGVRQSRQTGNVNASDDKRDIIEKIIDYNMDPLIQLGDKIDKNLGLGDYEEDEKSTARKILESSTGIGFISSLFRK